MPIDYSKYPANWKTQIRPEILAREEHKCKFCKVPNRIIIIRGYYGDRECYQTDDGNIFDAFTSEPIGADYLGSLSGPGNMVDVVLTVAHLDHNIENNDYSNLAALCQRCHNRHDKDYRKANRTEKQNRSQPKLF